MYSLPQSYNQTSKCKRCISSNAYSEGRIKFLSPKPNNIGILKLTAGVGKILYRVNCNEFVKNIYENHNFVQGKVQNIERIRETIPIEFMNNFNEGLNL